MARRAALLRAHEPEDEQVHPSVLLGRLRENVAELVKFYQQSQPGITENEIAVGLGIKSAQNLRNFIDGPPIPSTWNFLSVFSKASLGDDPGRLYWPQEQFKTSLVEAPPVPLQQAPGSRSIVSSPSSEDSGADSGNIAPDPKGVKRTSPTWGRLAALLRQWGASVTTPSPRPAFGHN